MTAKLLQQPNKEKLLQNILGQIILLNEYLTEVITDSHKNSLTDAIDTLYYIFQTIEKRNYDLSDSVSTRVTNYVNQILDIVLLNQI